MSRFARIAALHRELAEAYERVDAEKPPRARRKALRAPDGPEPAPALVASVRRRLRRQGVVT